MKLSDNEGWTGESVDGKTFDVLSLFLSDERTESIFHPRRLFFPPKNVLPSFSLHLMLAASFSSSFSLPSSRN